MRSNALKQTLGASALMALVAFAGCGSDSTADPGNANPDAMADGAGAPQGPPTAEPTEETKHVLHLAEGYETWATFPENPSPKTSATHRSMYVVTHFNDIVAQAMASRTMPLPDGSLIVKSNAPSATAPAIMLTLMFKQAGQWYWVGATTSGKVIIDETGKKVEGTGIVTCMGCHNPAKNDGVLTHDFSK